ncbi:MAG TPA: hypothetical protein PK156_23800, partial [Polyangium sp.]|nr:hypothetical protein [Polyangium sp.]
MTTKGMANSQPPSQVAPDESIGSPTKIDSSVNIPASQVPQRQTTEVASQVPAGQTPAPQTSNLQRASLAVFLVAPILAIVPLTRVLVDRCAPALADITITNLERAFAWREFASEAHVDDDDVLPEPTPLTIDKPLDDSVAIAPRS